MQKDDNRVFHDGQALSAEQAESWLASGKSPFPDLDLTVTEGERQIILLALWKLRHQRPGWAMAIGVIEDKLGGQMEWPAEDE